MKSHEYHTAKAIYASNAISDLIMLPTPLLTHSSLFICVVALASVVHLSACSFVLSGDEAYLAKERVRLGLGALKTFEAVWPLAGFVQQQLKRIAREVFALPRPNHGAALIFEDEIMAFIDENTLLTGSDGHDDSSLLALQPGLLSTVS